MKLIINREQLLANIKTVENYLSKGTEWEQNEIRKLIAKGKCLVAYQVLNELKFAPSRFLGYISNSLETHYASRDKDDVDGKHTNPAITVILNQKLSQTEHLETAFLVYCKTLGVNPSNYKKRKYWMLDE